MSDSDSDSFLTIYKIQCKDKSIRQTYIGSTGQFKLRIQSHISNTYNNKSNTYNYNLYKFIRENGGWENWDVFKIFIDNESKLTRKQLFQLENYFIIKHKPSLNTAIPKNIKYDNDISNIIKLFENNENNCEVEQKKIFNNISTNKFNSLPILPDETDIKELIPFFNINNCNDIEIIDINNKIFEYQNKIKDIDIKIMDCIQNNDLSIQKNVFITEIKLLAFRLNQCLRKKFGNKFIWNTSEIMHFIDKKYINNFEIEEQETRDDQSNSAILKIDIIQNKKNKLEIFKINRPKRGYKTKKNIIEERNTIEQNSIEENSIEENSIEENSIEENSIEENSIKKHNIQINITKNNVEEEIILNNIQILEHRKEILSIDIQILEYKNILLQKKI
jgi:hypothetical protein